MGKYEAIDQEIEALRLSEAWPPAPNPYNTSSDFSQEDYSEDD